MDCLQIKTKITKWLNGCYYEVLHFGMIKKKYLVQFYQVNSLF